MVAVFGVLGCASLASAQVTLAPNTLPNVQAPAAPPVVMPSPAGVPAPAVTALPVTQTPVYGYAPAYAPGAVPQGIYSNCGDGSAYNGPSKIKSLSNQYGIGAGCAMPLTCSNWAAERTFLFGSCRQFFSPGNQCCAGCGGGQGGGCGHGGGGGCGHGLGLGATNGNPPPSLGTYNTCKYSSYLNR
ncbi:hypothetical protein FRUB_00636 [Fimbriiglobus ruber]|uniref:Uncharacterized protein n=2 Tax=Fimbriiglobus ruber TaxID=1908690 RepID=A0A225EFB9_9BACT|nr:hypothetical protein FRUB_00636 [Fimbriiglobus ruber]